ncbi:Kelch-like protein 28 [Holothuria leucospilota]|uniref:Kelch-like protein 28 n=1 Tax=Holothuria leucospilota TaxID=206669 RepID=A0A9Q1CIG4_HOLLE|nr:Kelch-like protein 28 [Holothuria leucospilota]
MDEPADPVSEDSSNSGYEISEHSNKIMRGLFNLRQNQHLCDITLKVQDQCIHAHRAVLASGSPYFSAMFVGNLSEKDQKEVEIKSVDKNALEALVNYIYNGKIQISISNVQAILAAANLIQMKDVKQLCCDFLEQNLDTSNCLGITHFAETHACEEWALTARRYCGQHFEMLPNTEEFYQLQPDQLMTLLQQDDLAVPCEESILEILLLWIEFFPVVRVKYLPMLLQCVKLPLMTLKYLKNLLSETDEDNTEKYAFLQTVPQCREQICKAINYHMNPEERILWRKDSLYMIRPREAVKQICAVGGKNGLFATLKSFEICDEDLSEWKEATPLNCRRQECAAAVVNKCLYIIGGIKCYTRNGTTFRCHDNSMEKWSSKTNVWTSVTKMSKCRSNHGVAVLNGLIYAMGGYDGQFYLKSVEVYSPKKDEWRPVASMLKARSIFSAAAIEGKIFALGGYGPNYLNSVEKYDPEKNKWQLVSPMTHPRINFGAAVVDNFIYVVGGHDGATHLKSMEKYDPHQDKWQSVTPMTKARTGLGVTVLGGCIYAAGGHSGSVYLSEVEQYDPVSDTWTFATSMNNCRCNFAFVAL